MDGMLASTAVQLVGAVGVAFELVAADLQWKFDAGDPEPDAADAAVVADRGADHDNTAADGWRIALSTWSVGEEEAPRSIGIYELARPGA